MKDDLRPGTLEMLVIRTLTLGAMHGYGTLPPAPANTKLTTTLGPGAALAISLAEACPRRLEAGNRDPESPRTYRPG